jgi:hypothetical protein
MSSFTITHTLRLLLKIDCKKFMLTAFDQLLKKKKKKVRIGLAYPHRCMVS